MTEPHRCKTTQVHALDLDTWVWYLAPTCDAPVPLSHGSAAHVPGARHKEEDDDVVDGGQIHVLGGQRGGDRKHLALSVAALRHGLQRA